MLPAYRSPFGSRASLMRDGRAEVRIAARLGVGIGVGNALKHHGRAAARAARRLVAPSTEVFRMSCCRDLSAGSRSPRSATTGWQRSWSSASWIWPWPRTVGHVAEHSDARLLVLDLNAVTFLDSTGVRVLIEATALAPARAHASWRWPATGRCAGSWTSANSTAGWRCHRPSRLPRPARPADPRRPG